MIIRNEQRRDVRQSCRNRSTPRQHTGTDAGVNAEVVGPGGGCAVDGSPVAWDFIPRRSRSDAAQIAALLGASVPKTAHSATASRSGIIPGHAQYPWWCAPCLGMRLFLGMRRAPPLAVNVEAGHARGRAILQGMVRTPSLARAHCRAVYYARTKRLTISAWFKPVPGDAVGSAAGSERLARARSRPSDSFQGT